MEAEVCGREWTAIDFLDRLKDCLNAIPDLPILAKLGYLDDRESLVIYTLPGSAIQREYYDGTQEVALNIEIAIRSMDGGQAEKTMWKISRELEELTELQSLDGSFDFESIEVTSRPFVNGIHEQGWLVFLLNAKAIITQYKEAK